MKTGAFATIPASVRFDSRLSAQAKLLFGELSASSNQFGITEDDNSFFASIMNVDKRTITRLVSQLVDEGHVIYLVERGKRKLRLVFKNIPLPETVAAAVVRSVDREAVDAGVSNILSAWELKRNCDLQDKESLYSLISSRLKTYSERELLQAIEKRCEFLHKSAWHNNPANADAANDIRALILDDATVLKWLNANDN